MTWSPWKESSDAERVRHLDVARQSGALVTRGRDTVYLDHALEQLRATGYPVLDADVARLSPYMRRHINFHGHYSFALADAGGARRALATRPRSTRRRRLTCADRRCPQQTA